MKRFLKTQFTVAAVLAGALALGTGCKSDQSATRGTEPTPASDTTGTGMDSTGTGTDTSGSGTTTTPPPSSGGSGYDTGSTTPDSQQMPPSDSSSGGSGMPEDSTTPPPSDDSVTPGTGGSGTSESEPGVHDGEMTEPGTGGSGSMSPDSTMPEDGSLPNDSTLDPSAPQGTTNTPVPDSTGTLSPNSGTTR
ncbi:hypothetical protein D7V97_17555 [Corallococcus sp. CA053C]|uniref:hypothetical protein n=1 Tax=Corallococcus sp. CA053C TaxID=2316732 RepID=UPI000EA1ECD0|nr:hypothetical protein [Corallococcus sp. CA053C]RKH09116.1 hypothetical protein D7V97_17555 [Corallococcus sp. CA053C]